MMREVLPRTFYSRTSTVVARELIGKVLVRNLRREKYMRGIIVETEAYGGLKDPASHAYRGMTKRNAAMFGEAGFAYVYFTYGFHHCLNIVTGRKGDAQAVLLRAMEPIEGLDLMRKSRGGVSDLEIASGPGKICKAMNIDLSLNMVDVTSKKSAVFIEAGRAAHDMVAYRNVVAGTRIGIKSAVSRRWRFYDAESLFVSHRSKLNLPSAH